MKYYYGGEINHNVIVNFIAKHKTDRKKIQENIDFYTGKKMPVKKPVQDGLSNNKLNTNLAKYVTDTATGYFVGIAPKYNSISSGFSVVQEIFDKNDEGTINYEIAENMSMCGVGFDITYIDENKEVCIAPINPLSCFIICDDSVKEVPVCAVRYWQSDRDDGKKTVGEVYFPKVTKPFEISGNSLVFGDAIATPFSVPNITIYPNNKFFEGDFECAKTLIMAYNLLMSNVADDLENTANAYLVLKGYEQPDRETLQLINSSRVLGIDGDSDAAYITKNLNDTVISNHRNALREDIMQTTKVPDLTDEKFAGTASGVALEYKLWGLDQLFSKKRAEMDKALFYRLKLVCEAIDFCKNIKIGDVSKMINIKYVKNKPQDVASTIDNGIKLSGMVSEQTVHEIIESATGVTPTDEKKRMDSEVNGEEYSEVFVDEVGVESLPTTKQRNKK